MGQIFLIRHGQVEKRYDGTYYGVSDVGLSTDGEAQGTRVIKHLAKKKIVKVYSSPLRRAKSLAERASKKWKVKLQIVKGLHEMDFGKWEGLTYAQIQERFPKKSKSFMQHPHRVRLGGGENISDLYKRVIPQFHKIALAHPDENVAMVAHGGPLKAILADVMRAPKSSIFRTTLMYASISVLENWGDTFCISSLNYTDHLGDLLRQ